MFVCVDMGGLGCCTPLRGMMPLSNNNHYFLLPLLFVLLLSISLYEDLTWLWTPFFVQGFNYQLTILLHDTPIVARVGEGWNI